MPARAARSGAELPSGLMAADPRAARRTVRYLRARRELRGRAARFAPVHVGEVELDGAVEGVGAPVRADGGRYERARLLVRRQGAPLGFVNVDLIDGRASGDAVRTVVDGDAGCVRAHREPAPYGGLDEPVTVIVCTKDPDESLRERSRACYGRTSRRRRFSWSTTRRRRMRPSGSSRRSAAAGCGGSWSPSRACPARATAGCWRPRSQLVAFVDDDVRVDAGWLRGLLLGFSRAPRVGCVTGIVPAAELETPAQAFFDARVYWSAAFEPLLYDLGANRPDDPAFPYAAGAFGTRAQPRDPALGCGATRRLRRGAGDGHARRERRRSRLLPARDPGRLDPRVRAVRDRLAPSPARLDGLQRQMYTYGVGLSA